MWELAALVRLPKVTGYIIAGVILRRVAGVPVAAGMRRDLFDHPGGAGLPAWTTIFAPPSICTSTACLLQRRSMASQVTLPSFLLPPVRWRTPPSASICEPYSAVVTWPICSPSTRTAAGWRIDGRKAFKYHMDEEEFLRKLESR